MKKRYLGTLIRCLLLASPLTAPASAECVVRANPCQSWISSKAVWIGRVEKSEPKEVIPEFGPVRYDVRMEVRQVFWGEVKPGTQIEFVQFALGEFGAYPKAGESYFIYSRNSDGSGFGLGACENSKRLDWAEEDIALARSLQKGSRDGSDPERERGSAAEAGGVALPFDFDKAACDALWKRREAATSSGEK